MNYRVLRQGKDLGTHSFEELRRRREAGELSGNDYVRAGENSDWQPLDLVLSQGRHVPPPLPPPPVSRAPTHPAVWLLVVAAVLALVGFFGFFAYQVQRTVRNLQHMPSPGQTAARSPAAPEALAAARAPVVWTSNTLTVAATQKNARAFRVRQWLTGYEERGERNPDTDAAVRRLLRTWIASNYGGPEATNASALNGLADALAADERCTDALALTVVANVTTNPAQLTARFGRALAALAGSPHRAYPQFCANVWLARNLGAKSERAPALDAAALPPFQKCFTDGTFTPADQPLIAEILVNDWGYNFFHRNADAVCRIAAGAGHDYEWLALVLAGERDIIQAWQARGGGYAGTVTAAGWEGFRSHLAAARKSLTAAWERHPDFPLAPCRMIYVALGDSDISEMREWFDRTTVAQIDYPRAWKDLRWGLRPRWYGSEEALLALGRTAISSGRFDTDVPRKFIDCVYDVESEMKLPASEHIFGRDDI